MRNFGALYVVSALVFLAIDIFGLTYLLRPTFEANAPQLLAEDPNFVAAAMFYFTYIAGIVWFVSLPAIRYGTSMARVFGNGAALGFLAYGTYEFTNMATLAGWKWQMVYVDLIWGALLTGSVAVGGIVLSRRLRS
ncbi:MAG: DUF2177 family protein [Pseudomonadota bacterium]